jgi:predicted membrane chloride channel (bestrophin family)
MLCKMQSCCARCSHAVYNVVMQLCLQDRLLPHELAYIVSVKHPPNMAATVLTQLVASANLPEMLQISVDKQIVQYIDSVAACERLQKQPIPVAYTRLDLTNGTC